MQLSTEWTRSAGFHFPERQALFALRGFGTRLQSIKVFKTTGEFATLLAVTMTYWFVSAALWPTILFPLVRSAHQWGCLKAIFLVLALIGLFVIVNEPAHMFSQSHTPALKPALLVLITMLTLVTIAYWLNERVFAVLIDMARNKSFDSLSFFASNGLLMITNSILPILGGGFVARLTRQALRPKKVSRNS